MTISAGTLVPRDARDFGAYELIAKLATGGMAEIFLARRTSSATGSADEIVVLKRILPHLAEDEHFVTMFRDEAHLASRLEHANVGKVHNLGNVGATWFIVMEYLHGIPLSRVLTKLAKARQFLDVRLVASIIVQACEGLHHAHELTGNDGATLGVVHRDVSPPNIFVTNDGVVKLLDFGIAKARGASSKTRTGTVKGKNAYMSPEQILGKPLDRRSDLFALGAVMYELLAVKRLFHRDSDFLTFKAITEEPIPDIRDRRPDLPQALRSALNRSLSRDPSGRFATALEMAQAVRAAVSLQGGAATPAELAQFVKTDFADELAQKDELVAQAEAGASPSSPGMPPATAPSASSMMAAASSGNLAIGPTALGPRGRASSTFTETEELDVIDGEVEVIDRREQDATRPIRKAERPSAPVIVSQQGTPPPPPPLLTSPPVRNKIADGSVPFPAVGTPAAATPIGAYPAPPGVASSMIGLGDPSTDLLRDWRKKRVRNVAIGGAISAVVVVAFVAIIVGVGGSRPNSQAVTPPPATLDAAPAVVVPADASDRDTITALSKYGFYSVDASAKTQIFIDSQRVGEAPITRLPMTPGVHHVKAIGPKSKIKRFDITIYATQDTDSGTLQW